MPLGGGGLTGSPGGVTHALQADFAGTAFGGTPTWTDVTAWWMSAGSDPGGSSATIPWGRQDQSTTVESSSTSFTLNNADGRFTPGNPAGVVDATNRHNLCANPSFESGTTSWTPRSTGGASVTLAQSAAQAHSGTSSLLATSTAASVFKEGPVYTVATTVGATYTASTWVYVPAGTPAALIFQIGGTNGTTSAVNNAWTRLSVTFTASATSTQICVGVTPTAGAQTFYVDDVLIEAGGTLGAYFDGNTARLSPFVYSWDGTANASTSTALLSFYPNVKRRVRMRHTITDGTTTLTLFDGYVDSWTVTPQTSGPTLATVSLSDGFARLQVSTGLRSMYVEEIPFDSPAALYLLDEPAGATSASDETGNYPPAVVQVSPFGAGTLTFGNSGPVIGQTMMDVTSPDAGQAGLSLRSTWLKVPYALPGLMAATYDFWFVGPTSPPPVDAEFICTLIETYAPGGNTRHFATFIYETTGYLGVDNFATVSVNVCDGQLHHVQVDLTSGGSGHLYLDGVLRQTAAIAGGVGAPIFPPTGSWILGALVFFGDLAQKKATEVAAPFAGSIAMFGQYASVLSSARALAHYNAGANAFAGESTSARWARLLSYRPNLGGTSTGTLGTVGTGDLTGMSIGAALEDTATAEGGVIQTNRGTITLIGRSNWYDPVTTLTLDASNGEVDLPTTWRDDTQGFVNDVTVSRPAGSDQRSVNTASTTGADGVSQTSISANLNSDRDAADMAGWSVAVGVREQLGSPTLTVNLYARSSAALTMAVCALKTFDVITLVNLPRSAPTPTMTFQVQGGTYNVGADTFSVELYTTTMPPTVLRADASADAYTKLDSGNILGW